MWVFDGEEWTEEGGSAAESKNNRPEMNPRRFDEFVPELQVIEIVQIPRPNTQVPPLPLP
jgi:hypothetical protein